MRSASFRSGPLALMLVGPVFLAAQTFQFDDNTAFDGVAGAALPASMVVGEVELRMLEILAPDAITEEGWELQPASGMNTSFRGLAIDNVAIANSAFSNQFGDDAASETNALNYGEAFVFDFDRTVTIESLSFQDIEQFEEVTLTAASGESVVLEGTAAWSAGSSGFTTFSGAALGDFQGILLPRGTQLTLAFDTVSPDDRLPDGDGEALGASPSLKWSSIEVSLPIQTGLATAFVVLGGAESAMVGTELSGISTNVAVRWTNDLTAGWSNTLDLGNQNAGLILDATLTGLTPGTRWYFQFLAEDGSETVESPVASFIWYEAIYVSPEGNDTDSGLNATEPLRTLTAALDRIREMKRRPQPEGPLVPNFYGSPEDTYAAELAAHLDALVDPVTIYLLPGYHFPEETIRIDKELDGNIHFVGLWDNGAAPELATRLSAHAQDPDWLDLVNAGIPIVSGGKQITEWTESTLDGRIVWVAQLPEVADGLWHFSQLFVDGHRATRSRWPKEGWFRMDEANHETTLDFRIAPEDLVGIEIESWAELSRVEVVTLKRWVEDRNRVASFNPETRWMALQPPASDFDLFGSHPSHDADLAAFYFDNVFATLSEPGEFYLNETTGELYYLPQPGQTVAETEVIAPRLETLFEISGRPAGPTLVNSRLWNVTFQNMALLHTQVAPLERHVGTFNSPVYSGDGAIRYRFARNGFVEGCFFGHLGEAGIEMAEETAGFRIGANFFRSMGAGAIKTWQDSGIDDLQERTGWNHIHDNDILGYGRFWHGAVAVLANTQAFTTIEHNHIRRGYLGGINISGVESSLLRFGFGNHIRNNHIHDLGPLLSDYAGIYAPGKNPHGLIEGNRVHDIIARDYTSPALYLDGTAEYWTVRNNWFYRSNTKLINMKGWSHLVENNVFAFAGNEIINRRNGDLLSNQSTEFPLLDRTAPVFERNLYLQTAGTIYEISDYDDVINPWAELDQNLFWNPTADLRLLPTANSLVAFQSQENEELNSFVADPLFSDPLSGDFRLLVASPAPTLTGFTDFDNRAAGIRPSIWSSAGMPHLPAVNAAPSAFSPETVPSLLAWLDADRLALTEKLADWPNQTHLTYSMQQFDPALQPAVVLDTESGRPVVHFDGGSWMANNEFAGTARAHAGRFGEDDFAIIAVTRVEEGIFLAKGDGSSTGNWLLRDAALAFHPTPSGLQSAASDGLAIRSWVRKGDTLRFYLNGALQSTAEWTPGTTFDSSDILFLGRNGGTPGGSLRGDVAEILIFEGSPAFSDLGKIHQYLHGKWIADAVDLFVDETGSESRAAIDRPYIRDLKGLLAGDTNPALIVFTKLDGPFWLEVGADGSLRGTPGPSDTGAGVFAVAAELFDGRRDLFTLTIEVGVADNVPPPAPSLTRLSFEAPGEVLLEWSSVDTPDFSHYEVWGSSTLSGSWSVEASPVFHPRQPITVTEPVRFFQVRAIDTSGN